MYPDSNFKEDFIENFEEILPTTNISVETKILKVSRKRHKINPILIYNNQAQKIEDENATKYIYLVNREGDKSHSKLFSEDWFHLSKNQNPNNQLFVYILKIIIKISFRMPQQKINCE